MLSNDPFRPLRALIRIALVAPLAIAASAGADEICVDPDDGDCEATIQAGVDAASAGDTIEIEEGDYEENVIIPPGLDGLTLQGAGDDTILRAPGGGDYGIAVRSVDVTIENLTIRGGDGAGGIVFFEARGRVEDVRLVDIGFGGACLVNFGDELVVTDSKLGPCNGGVVSIDTSDVHVVDNSFEACSFWCVLIMGDAALVEDNRFERQTALSLPGFFFALVEILPNDATDLIETIFIKEQSGCVFVQGNEAEIVDNWVTLCDEFGIYHLGDNGLLEENFVAKTGRDGIHTVGASNEVTGNTARKLAGSNPDGISVEGDDAIVVDNLAEYVTDDAFVLGIGENSARMMASGNVGRDSGASGTDSCFDTSVTDSVFEDSHARRCGDEGWDISGSDSTHENITGRDNLEDGIDVSGSRNTFEDSEANRNVFDGFQVVGVDHTLEDNEAGNNGFRDLCDDGTGTVLIDNDFEVVGTSPGCELP